MQITDRVGDARRILVYGVTGSGKSTLARALGEIVSIPVLDADHLCWRPGWVQLPKDEQRALIDELTRADLVRREANSEDARSAYAVITPAGLARFREAAPVYVAGIDQEFAGELTVAELSTLAATLRRVLLRFDLAHAQQ